MKRMSLSVALRLFPIFSWLKIVSHDKKYESRLQSSLSARKDDAACTILL